MRKLIASILLLSFVAPSAQAAEIATRSIRNCVNIKSGEARLVSAKVTRCSKAERLVKLVIPVVEPESRMHSGEGAPVDFQTGHDGDFYIDAIGRKFYGPRVAGVWGAGTLMVGEVGPVGKSGSTLISGNNPPEVTLGIDGDFYLDITAKIIYGPKSERSGWGVGSSITGPQGVQGNSGPQGVQGVPGGFGAFGSFYDTTTVVLTQGVATAIPLNVTQFASGVKIESGSKITFSQSGKFNIAFSLQILKEDAGDDLISLWLCKGSGAGTCTNVPWTNTDLLLAGANAHHVAAWNFFVSANSSDYFQLMISSAGTTLKTKILSSPAQTAPIRPEIPGTILTVNQVG